MEHAHLPTEAGVYALVNSETQRLYVGSANNVRERVAGHKRELRRGVHSNWKLRRDVFHYGISSLSAVVLELCDSDSLRDREQFWIDQLQACDQGYNINRKAVIHPHEVRQRIGRGVAKRPPLTDEQRERHRIACLNRPPQSQEVLDRISASLLGHKRTAESIEKQRSTMRGRKQSEEHVRRRMESTRLTKERKKCQRSKG